MISAIRISDKCGWYNRRYRFEEILYFRNIFNWPFFISVYKEALDYPFIIPEFTANYNDKENKYSMSKEICKIFETVTAEEDRQYIEYNVVNFYFGRLDEDNIDKLAAHLKQILESIQKCSLASSDMWEKYRKFAKAQNILVKGIAIEAAYINAKMMYQYISEHYSSDICLKAYARYDYASIMISYTFSYLECKDRKESYEQAAKLLSENTEELKKDEAYINDPKCADLLVLSECRLASAYSLADDGSNDIHMEFELLKEAYDVCLKNHNESDPFTLNVYTKKASYFERAYSDHKKAAEMYRNVYDIMYHNNNDQDSSDMFSIIVRLGDAYYNDEQWNEAADMYIKADKIGTDTKDGVWLNLLRLTDSLKKSGRIIQQVVYEIKKLNKKDLHVDEENDPNKKWRNKKIVADYYQDIGKCQHDPNYPYEKYPDNMASDKKDGYNTALKMYSELEKEASDKIADQTDQNDMNHYLNLADVKEHVAQIHEDLNDDEAEAARAEVVELNHKIVCGESIF